MVSISVVLSVPTMAAALPASWLVWNVDDGWTLAMVVGFEPTAAIAAASCPPSAVTVSTSSVFADDVPLTPGTNPMGFESPIIPAEVPAV